MKILKTYSKAYSNIIIQFELDEVDVLSLETDALLPNTRYYIEGSFYVEGDEDDPILQGVQDTIDHIDGLEDVNRIAGFTENFMNCGMGDLMLGNFEDANGDEDIALGILFRPLDIFDNNEKSISQDSLNKEEFLNLLYTALDNYLF